MPLQNNEAQNLEIQDGHPTGDELFDGLLASADRALALGDRYLAILLINEIYRAIDAAD